MSHTYLSTCPPLSRLLPASGTALSEPLFPQLLELLVPMDITDVPRPEEQGGRDMLPGCWAPAGTCTRA